MLGQGGDVQALVVLHRTGVILHRNDLPTGLRQQLGGHAAHVAEALHDHLRPFERNAQLTGRLAGGEIHTASRGLDPAQRAAQFDRLAGDDTGDGGTLVGRVGVHHPGHDLAVGVDIGRRNVLGRPDDHADLAGVAAGEFFQFVGREFFRIDADAALGTAVGDVDCGVLDGHPCRKCHHLFQCHVRVIAHAALAGPARDVVLHAVALEVGHGAIVQLDRNIDDQGTLGFLEGFDPFGQRPEVGRDLVDLCQIGIPGAARLRREIRQLRHDVSIVSG